jgi:hypothetical protein
MKIRRLDKLPKRKVTIEELLDLIDTHDAVDILLSEKDTLDELLVIYTKEHEINWVTNGMTSSRMLWIIETVKTALLNERK